MRSNFWTEAWDEIVQNGTKLWKVTDAEAHAKALSHIKRNLDKVPSSKAPVQILCPLAGDDLMIKVLWEQGYSITTIDLTPAAVESLRSQFMGNWEKQEKQSDDGFILWKHESNRLTVYQGDALKLIPELVQSFDCVYDKDSLGALSPEMRNELYQRVAEYCKKDAILYIEVKLRDNHDEVKGIGPPYSFMKDDIVLVFQDKNVKYIEDIGVVYDIDRPDMKQTAHVLQKQ